MSAAQLQREGSNCRRGLMPRKLATARGLEPWLLPQESGFNFFPLVVQLQVVAVAGLREPRCWNLERKGTKFWFRRSPIAPSQKTLLENAAKRFSQLLNLDLIVTSKRF